MRHHGAQLFLLAGLWLSLVAFAMGGSTLLPDGKNLRDESPALLYKVALNGEIRRPGVTLGEGRSIVANLQNMQLSLYENAAVVQTFPILSIGREGTFWETPTGSYVVQTKEIRHFSSIGEIWMPYSMQFYGNFFIHGWPTYPDGTDVSGEYSGGCIRLATDDAEKVYDFSSIGTNVFVVGGTSRENFATTSRYYLRGGGGLPTLSASSFVVADIDQGSILWERGAQVKRSPGNLVSLVTALAALETVDQYKKVRISELLLGHAVLRKYSVGSLDEIPSGALIYPLLFGTNDTAAKIFSREHGTRQFVKYMNKKASMIGMEDTIFGGALSVDNSTTTARDLFRLLQYVNKQKHFLIDVTRANDQTLVSASGVKRYSWENKNPWIVKKDGTYRGGVVDVQSNGSGNAIVLFELPLSEFNKRTIAFIVLDSKDVVLDVETLRTFISEHFVYGVDATAGSFVREGNGPTPSLFRKMKDVFDLGKLLEGNIEYERDV